MSIENNFFATDSCEWSNANYSECLCPLPQCPVSHFRFLSACRDDLDWKLHDSRIVPPPWSRLTFLPRLAVTWMLVWHLSCFLAHLTHAETGFILLPCGCHSSFLWPKMCSDCSWISCQCTANAVWYVVFWWAFIGGILDELSSVDLYQIDVRMAVLRIGAWLALVWHLIGQDWLRCNTNCDDLQICVFGGTWKLALNSSSEKTRDHPV